MAAGKWNAGFYDAKHAFVWQKAKGVVALLAANSGERILDLGCGTGTLTQELAACGAQVVGVDHSPEMIYEARKKFPQLRFELCDARSLSFSGSFDAVFSNAALHWIPEADLVIQGVSRALKPGGRFVAEFGGKGNVRHVVTALETALAEFGISADGANPGITQAWPSMPRSSKSTAWKYAKLRYSNGRLNWKMASAAWKCGSLCSAKHFCSACHRTRETTFCGQSGAPRAPRSGRLTTGNWITADFASRLGKPRRSSIKKFATTCGVGLYSRQPTCYIFLPYRHPCARRLGL